MARAVLFVFVVCFLLTSAMIPLAWSHPAQAVSLGGSSLLVSVSIGNRICLVGEVIGIRLVLINPTLSEIRLVFGNGHWIDYEIISDGAVLYRWDDHWTFSQQVWSLTMPPLEVRECDFPYPHGDYPLLNPGVYLVRGIVVGYAEAYASLVIADVLPGLVLRAFSVTLGIGLVVILVFVTGYALTKRPALKRHRPWRKSPNGASSSPRVNRHPRIKSALGAHLTKTHSCHSLT
jgi:hypothetical protein